MGRTTGLRSGRRRPSSSNGGMAGQSHGMNEPTPSSNHSGETATTIDEILIPQSAQPEATAPPPETSNGTSIIITHSSSSRRRDSSSLEPGRLAQRRNPTTPPTFTSSTQGGGGGGGGGGVATRLSVAAAAQDSLSKECVRRSAATVTATATIAATNVSQQASEEASSSCDIEMIQQLRPGAYTDTGMSLVRAQSFQKTEFRSSNTTTTPTSGDGASSYDNAPQQCENEINNSHERFRDEEVEDSQPQAAQLDQNNSSNNNTSARSVVVAKEVLEEEEYHNNSGLPFPTATGMDAEELQERITEEQKKNALYFKAKAAGITVVLVATLIIIVVVIIKTTSKDFSSSSPPSTTSPTASPTTRPKPPMEKYMEVFYNNLPDQTKENLLHNNDSPQGKAWDWLQNHPNITIYPEWRKTQIFAMATFFYSLEGPSWPELLRNKWLNVNASECHWTLSEAEVMYFTQHSADIFGPDAYKSHVIQPCNQNGEIQSLVVHQLYLSDEVEPHMPPEIGLLKSLKILGIMFSQIGGSKLSDFLVPELMQELPNLEYLSFQSTSVGGTIPKGIGSMTGLRHFIIGDNQISGTFPSEIASMSSLEYILLWRNNVAGTIPTELGEMTSLTALEIDYNHLTGFIPTELGLITNVQQFLLGNNALGGSIPTELGLMTNCIQLTLGNNVELSPEGPYNNFVGSLPTELWQLSNLEKLFLSNLPDLHGSIPTESMPGLTRLNVEGSPHLNDTIPN